MRKQEDHKDSGRREEHFPLSDLLGISKGKNLAFLKAYFDESMSHHRASPKFFALGGCTMQNESWLSLGKDWSAALQAFGVSKYRSSDCNASKGEFEGWDGLRKDQLRNHLVQVINRSWRGKSMTICPVYTWIVFDMETFEQESEKYPLFKISPYELSVIMAVGGCREAIANIKGGNTLGIFFEEGQAVRPHVRKYLRQQEISEVRIVDISFVSKEDHLPLQVADMIAYEALKSHFEGTRKFLLDLIESGIGRGIICDEEMIRKFFLNASGG